MSSSVVSDATSWKRGRPAGILSLWPPLSFRAMLQAATLSAGTASASAVERRLLLAGANPAQQLSLRLVAARAGHGGNDMD